MSDEQPQQQPKKVHKCGNYKLGYNEYHRQYREKNKDIIRERAKEFYERNRERLCQERRERYQRQKLARMKKDKVKNIEKDELDESSSEENFNGGEDTTNAKPSAQDGSVELPAGDESSS